MSDHTERRQQLLADAEDEVGERWREQYLPGSAGCHELLDRTAMVLDLLDRYIVEHPACFENEAWFELAAEAARLLQSLYQRVGEVHLGVEEPGAAGTSAASRG